LRGTGLAWADLDTSGNGVLDDRDDFVSVFGRRTIIDLGAAADEAPGINTVTLLNVTGLTEFDFLFGGS
jgi:hypothetical protein